MPTDLLSLITNAGPFGGMALFIYLWQRAEARADSFRKDLEDLRDAYEVKTDAHIQTLLELQEKRLVDLGRLESVGSSMTSAMNTNSGLIRAVLGLLQQRGTR